MTSKHNHPFDEVVKAGVAWILKGATVYQKFTCSYCGARQTMGVPNKFYKFGICEECDSITNIEQTGCNYLLHFEGRS